jgi:hypothetical protein
MTDTLKTSSHFSDGTTNWSLENSKRGFRLVAAGPNGTQRVDLTPTAAKKMGAALLVAGAAEEFRP